MSSRSSSVARKDLPHYALITPSASPPIFRTPALPHIRRDNYSPTKRARLSLTPSSTLSGYTASSSSATVQNDLDAERRASTMRLLSIWDQLAAKYDQPLDGDDIVDLRDGTIVQDRGVLRRAEKLELGNLIADDASSEGGGAETEGDDDVDELDAFAPGADISDELISGKELLNIKPVHALDPTDAEDLQAFLEEERQRRELYGDEEEEEIISLALLSGERASTTEPSSDLTDNLAFLEGLEDDKDDEVAGEDLLVGPRRSGSGRGSPTGRSKSAALLLDDDSEDEFLTWEIDNSSPPKPPPSSDPLDVSSEFTIDLAGTPTRYASNGGRSQARSRAPSQPPAPSVKSRAMSKTSARQKSVKPMPTSPPPTRANNPPTQLITPPLSSSTIDFSFRESFLPATPTSPPSPPVPRPPKRTGRTPAPMSKHVSSTSQNNEPGPSKVRPEVPIPDWDAPLPRPSPRFTPIRKLSNKLSLPRLMPMRPLVNTPPVLSPLSATKNPKRRVVPEVIMPSRQNKAGTTKSPTEREVASQTVKAADAHRFEKGKQSRKGKEKAVGPIESSPETPISKTYAATRDGGPRASRESDRESSLEIPRPSMLRARKRKRIMSTSSISEHSAAEEPDEADAPSSPTRWHTAAKSRSSSVYDSPTDKRHMSPARSEDELDTHSRERSRSQNHTKGDRLPSMAPIPPVHLHSYPHTPSRSARQQEFAPPHAYIQGSDAHAQFAQAVQHLSYLAASVFGIPLPGQGFPTSYPQPYPTHAPHWLPYTPTHTRHHSRPPEPSGDTYASGSSAFRTPIHRHHSFPDPSFSNATLPPSSPPESPEHSSPAPIERSTSSRARSKSRGRRVSFKLDGDARPAHAASPQDSEGSDQEISVAEPRRSRDVGAGASSGAHPKGRGRRSYSAGPPPLVTKGQARASSADSEADENISSHKGSQSHRVERGRTPGPPSHHQRSQSVRAKSRARDD